MSKNEQGQEKSIETKSKNLFEIIKRIDSYIISTNNKSAIIISYCAAVIGWLSLGFEKIYSNFNIGIIYWAALASGLILGLSACYCIYLSFQVIFPKTNSTNIDETDDSIIFFGDIKASAKGAAGYCEKVIQSDEAKFLDDQCRQAHTIATIASTKFSLIKEITFILNKFNFPSLALLVFLICLNHGISWSAK